MAAATGALAVRIYEDMRLAQARVAVLQYGVVVACAALLVVFWYVQVLRGHHYRELAENNQSRQIPIQAPRGPMLDRSGVILVENRASFSIVLRPEDCPNLDATIAALSRVLRVSESQIRERIARRGAPFQLVVVKANASAQDVASIVARRFELPQIEVNPVPLRSYPLGAAGAHALGRVGEITERQLHATEGSGLRTGLLIGQAGLEVSYNRFLMGREGTRRVIVNSHGVEVREEKHEEAVDGPRLDLAIDAGLQLAMEQAFGEHAGCGVALDPRTGEILAMVSRPAFDPNNFSTGIDPSGWARLSSDPTTPLINRVIQGQYSPGSLFKIIMATAALEEGVITPETTLHCGGQITLYGNVFHCHRAQGHGTISLRRALAESCNVFFFQVGVKLAIGRIAQYARKYGLGSATGLDLPNEMEGLVPDPEWKQRVQGRPWYAGETVSVAIGQGQVNVTPLQMACVAACVANGGRLPRPHIVRAIGGVAQPVAPLRDTGFKPETIAAVREGMWEVVNESGGTGARAQIPGYDVCGKTGTAQVVTHERLVRAGKKEEMQPHGWFIGFAPRDNPRVAFAFLVEHGGSGSGAAAPVAQTFLKRFFGTEDAKPVARAN
jgi:penicillin-binding protein 2